MFITIQDVNDNKPTFQTNGFTYTTSIPENTQVGTAIFFQMGAVDNDREVCCYFTKEIMISKKMKFSNFFLQARNAKFQYSISGDPDKVFRIEDPNIGRIELNKTVDYEMKQQYTFLVSNIK